MSEPEPTTIDSTEDLLVTGLKEVYYAEHRLLDALEELSETTTREEIERGFEEHREETQGHVERLEEVFEMLDVDPEQAEDPVVDAMIESHEAFMEKDPDEDSLDRFNVAAGQKSEHYEIATYGNLTPLADDAGYDEAADVLEAIMREEQDALEKLSEIGEQFDEDEL